jgi:hypothetical protein
MRKAPSPRRTIWLCLGPYYYGKHKWDNDLLDVQETLESGNAAHRQNIRLQSGALDVARKQVEELRQQTDRNIDEYVHLLDESVQAFYALRQQVEYRKQEMFAFLAWQAQHPPSPAPPGPSWSPVPPALGRGQSRGSLAEGIVTSE